MNRGFTLAELLGVIAIIGIIATIVTVTVDKNIKNSRYETCIIQEETIKEATKMWMIDNPFKLNDKSSAEVTIEELDLNGYISDLKSPMTGKKYSDGTNVIIKTKKDTKKYIYEIVYGKEKEKCTK